ncbi:GNAT family N-acetyltransferase [Nocardioides sp. MAHUQ-72]|uniref:GNAT family N-acetyltransferase n=1 Tax=unclassified Nocardioides TaxID=2615069 RepID=UPI003613A69B
MSSPHVRIVQLDAATLASLADQDLERALETSPVPLTPWLAGPDCAWTWGYRARQVVERPEDAAWVTGVLWDEDAGVPVGKAGFHGAPDGDGMVEVGYAVDPAYRRRGYARAALELMIARAQADPSVRTLRATVSPDNAPSLALVGQYPFVENGEQWDEEDGLEIIFELAVDQPGRVSAAVVAAEDPRDP